MILEFESMVEWPFDFDGEEVASLVINEAIRIEGAPKDCEVSLTIVDDEEIRRINKEFRNMDKATDVLSFPAMEFEKDGGFSNAIDATKEVDMDTGCLILGDIVISYEHVIAQALDFGHTKKREFAFLIAHSMLHLFGYDHMEDDERIRMEEKQEVILSGVNINRS